MPELVWEGKYDDDGRRVAPPRVSLPFQTVETVNESAQERQRSLDFFAEERATDWRNRLVWGDNKYVLPALLEEFAGQVDLIYIDPPFATGQDFSFRALIGDEEFIKQPSLIEQKAYRDMWGKGLDSYIGMLYDRLACMAELLSQRGSIYVHLGTNVSHPIKLVMDELLGDGNFRNEIVWKRATTVKGNFGQGSRLWGPATESILFYTKSDDYTFNQPFGEYSEEYLDTAYRFVEPDSGRRYRLVSMIGPGGKAKGNPQYEVMGVTRYWRYSQEAMQDLIERGLVVQSKPGTVPNRKYYLDEGRGVPVQSLWDDIGNLQASDTERTGYATQKPEALLERIIEASSERGDLVADFFCGSGTTAAVAEKLGRRWIACDLGRFAVHTTRKRLLNVADVQPFAVENLGKYERQLWQEAEFGESATARTASYRSFILDLYRATPVAGYTWLHGLKQGRMVYVGTVDAPVTTGDVKQIVVEFRKAVGTGKDAPKSQSVDVLGWDFAFELNEIARQDAQKANIDLRLVRIPREVLDKRAVEQGDIKFFELAALSVGTAQSRRKVTLTLEDFIIPLDDVPADVQAAVTHWSQWIDYWAVDWDNKGDTFHNEWQAYRTRKSRDLALATEHTYAEPGDYTVVLKVIDILGNDTTKTISVRVAGRGA
jgi:adenine-specific DNA-methyltransferase